MSVKSVSRVKSMVDGYIGQKVKFRVRKGKSKPLTTEGVIKSTYPSIFTVYVEKDGMNRMMSFNYIDIITNYVEIFICGDEEKKIV